MTAEQILVLILGITLAVFLILGITFVVILIKLVNKVRTIADHAETAVANVTSVTNLIRSNIKPAFISGTILKLVKKAIDSKTGRKSSGKK